MTVKTKFNENDEAKCSKCGTVLSLEEDVDTCFEYGVYRSILRCYNNNCGFEEVLDETTEKMLEKEIREL